MLLVVLFAGLEDEPREQLRQLLLALQRSIAAAPETGLERPDAESRRRGSPRATRGERKALRSASEWF